MAKEFVRAVDQVNDRLIQVQCERLRPRRNPCILRIIYSPVEHKNHPEIMEIKGKPNRPSAPIMRAMHLVARNVGMQRARILSAALCS